MADRQIPFSGPMVRRRNLIKAAALLLAEIERLDRLPALPGDKT